MKSIQIFLTIGLLFSALFSQAQRNGHSAESGVKEEQRYVHAHGMPYKGKILMVASSPAVSKQTGWPIGFWAAELTHPLHVFQEAGYEVELASTEGGEIKMDVYSDPTHESGYAAHDVITLGYMQQGWFSEMLANTRKLAEVNPDDYDAIFLVGGQAPMYTFRGNRDLAKLFAGFYESGKPSAAVCHSTTLLLEAEGSDGELIVKGKTWTGFANSEEDYADQAVGQKIQPYRIEDEARKISGTTFKVADAFSSYAIADGNLITGQQQNSGAAAARMAVQQLSRQ
ncbi:MAG: type 1 glutamine amidotransferase domain-containing protein [Phaeodactylibacter sp.]|nr:type 1 glutamine amidotransferase domain-containing protein [Phaeodactylibacter sp.]